MTNKTLLASAAFFLFAVPSRATVMDALRAAAYDASAEGGLEQQSKQAGASFEGSQVSPRGNFSAPTSASQLMHSASAAPAETASAEKKTDEPPPVSGEEKRNLKLIRAGGVAVAAAGGGLLLYSLLAAASGPIGWAAAALFFGGMSAYLANRRLHGKDDFKAKMA